MSHADVLILKTYDELRIRYRGMPSCLDLKDEPRGDFGIAHFIGIDSRGCAHLTFDEGRPPSKKTIAHELAHAMHRNCGGSPNIYRASDPVLQGFVAAMAYPYSLSELIARGAAPAATPSEQWRRLIGEQLAEAFAYIVLGLWPASDGGMWALHGGRLVNRTAALDAFFRSLRAVPIVGVTRPITREEVDMDPTIVQRMIDEAIASERRAEIEYRARLQEQLDRDYGRPIAELQKRVVNAGEILSAGQDAPNTP